MKWNGLTRRAVAASVTLALAALPLCSAAQDMAAPNETTSTNTTSQTSATVAPAAVDPIQNGAEDAVPILDHLPAGALIEIRIDETINTKTHKTGDWFAISLSQPILLGDTVVIPAGVTGRGQVVHAAKSGWGGKPGELILAARYLEFEGQKIMLRSMKLGGVGDNNETLAFATSVAGGLVAMPLVFALNGKSANIAAGTLANAKLTADLYPAAPPVSTPAGASAPPPTIAPGPAVDAPY